MTTPAPKAQGNNGCHVSDPGLRLGPGRIGALLETDREAPPTPRNFLQIIGALQGVGRIVKLPAATCPQRDLAEDTLLQGWPSGKWDVPGYRPVLSSFPRNFSAHRAPGDYGCAF